MSERGQPLCYCKVGWCVCCESHSGGCAEVRGIIEFVCVEASGLNVFALHKGCLCSLLMREALQEIEETFLEFTCVRMCW